MSTILVNTLTGTSTAGSIAVTGEGNSTTTNLQQGLCKTWVNFNGSGTVAIRTSFNQGSLTDNGTGDYTVNFTNAFSDEPAANMTSGRNNVYYSATGNTSNIRFRAKTEADALSDTTILTQSAHGDLA